MQTRNEKLLSRINPANQIGIEIGPLDRPIVTREMGQIRYIDHDTTEALRAKYAAPSTHVNLDKIVDVDYVWGDKSLLDLVQAEVPFDYVIASHVLEHIPDLIGWLSEVRSILKPGGILSLAIPDKRRCFDYYRQPTRTADVVEAYLHGNRKPSPLQIFDQLASSVSFQGNIAWNGAVDESQLVRCHTLEEAWQVAETSAKTGSYCDVHCWVLTPYSFFKLLYDLAALNLLKFDVVQFYETEGCEFLVSLQATETPNQRKLESLIESLADEFSTQLSTSVADAMQELKFVRQQLQAMESSKFWKMRTIWFKVKRKLDQFVKI